MCGCERLTFLCECRHKERRIQRCQIYQLRERGSCLAWCFPACRAKTRRHRVRRLCRECDAYFHEKYGGDVCGRFAQLFLDYKESKGWGKVAIDPRTVPREVLVQRQSAPARLGTQNTGGHGRARGQPFQVHQPMAMRAMTSGTQPVIIPKGERRATPPANGDHSHERRAAGQPIQQSGQQPPATRPSTPYRYVDSLNKPLPTDPSLFAVGDDEDEDEGENVTKWECIRTPSPKPKYTNGMLPPCLDVVVPELAHLAQGRQTGRARFRCATPELKQPAPKTYKAQRAIEKDVDSNLVRMFTNMARHIDIPNIDWLEFEGKLVPRIMTPPRGKRKSRASLPLPPRSSSRLSITSAPYSAINIAIVANVVPDILIPGRRSIASSAPEIIHSQEITILDSPGSSSSSTCFVPGRADSRSPTSSSARVRFSPTHSEISIPSPRRLSGVLIPSSPTYGGGRGAAFRAECGLPSSTYLGRDCQSVQSARFAPSPVLLFVHIPARRYSCAAQAACYCDNDDGGIKCPSCRERDAIGEQFHIM
ncbi:hypothetical protein F5Y07DRAFT_177511 [Xylaria sp. FL0933]|nr:hypothetical protein F5Y07DRAFT_177511 [Xylaria sp. FL0933]